MLEALETYAICTLDPMGIVLSWNRGAELAFGYTASDAVGRHFGIMFPEEDRKIGEPARDLDAALTHGKHETEGWQIDRLGRYRWHYSITECIRDDRQNPVGFVRVSRFHPVPFESGAPAADAQTMPQSQRDKLETIAHFTQRVIHDYNNLLSIITSNLERLHSGVQDQARARHILESALRAAQRAAAVTHQLYLFGVRSSAQKEQIDAIELVRTAEPSLRIACGNAVELSLNLELPTALVHLDPTDFEISLLNLVTNACDAMSDHGKVWITARAVEVDRASAERMPKAPPGSYLSLSVSDNGPGMPPNVAKRAFEPFFTTKQAGAGSGLGLSQVHGLAQQCGGQVDIKSEVGKGTSVTLLLPIVDPAEAAAR